MEKKSKESSVGIRDALGKREEIVHIAVIAAFLALGVSLFGSYIHSEFNEGTGTSLWIGALLVFIATAYLIAILLRARRTSYKFEAVIPIRKDTQRISAIPGYELTEEVSRTLDAAFLENEALELAWKNEPPVSNMSSNDRKRTHGKHEGICRGSEPDPGADVRAEPTYWAIVKADTAEGGAPSRPPAILTEVLEFVVLKQLSLHLSEYFGRFDDRDSQIGNRSHVPELLLENRILSLLSTPIEDRALFAKTIKSGPAHGTLHAIYGSDGSMYSRFDLVLPKGAKIQRPAPGVLQIDNRRASLTIGVYFEGFAATLPKDFEQAYLGVQRRSVERYQVKIFLTTVIKARALFRSSGWIYYEWIDSFAERLRRFSEFDAFLGKVGWEAAITHFRIAKNLRNQRTGADG